MNQSKRLSLSLYSSFDDYRRSRLQSNFLLIMSMSSKAADILLETGSSFKRIADLTMELIDPNRLSSTSSTPKIPSDSSELKRLRDALFRFSSDLDGVSQRIQNNRETTTVVQDIERLVHSNGNDQNHELDQTPDESHMPTNDHTSIESL
jgi:hypothetical protein